jgi:serpin B
VLRFAIALLVVLSVVTAGCGSETGDTPGGQSRAVAAALQADLPRETPTVPADDAAKLSDANARFGGRLTAHVAREEPTLVLSPFSISDALAMTFAGARGETERQMAAALGFDLGQERLHPAFNALERRVSAAAGDDVRLSIANALYVQRGMTVRRPFLDTLARHYGSGLRTVDFRSDPPGAVKEINDWVAAETEDRIKDLLDPDGLPRDTRLVLANAIHLDAKWQQPFEHRATRPAPFDAPSGTKQVPTMHQMSTFAYAQHTGSRTLELPYRGGRLALDIVLPDDGRLPEVLRTLERDPGSLVAGLEPQPVQVALPKLELRSSLQLVEPMQALGMRDAFDASRADFSGMAAGPPLYVGQIVHQAFMRVDEDGTEAAAATAVGMRATSAGPSDPVSFNVDRPFAFLLRDRQTGAVLFTGVISDPA